MKYYFFIGLTLFGATVVGLNFLPNKDIYSMITSSTTPLPIPKKIIITPEQSEITITANQFKFSAADGFDETDEWGYNGTSPGPTIEVEKGQKLIVHWKSDLPETHIFESPEGAMTAPNVPDVRTVVHVHGAAVTNVNPQNRSENNDGWPDTWIKPGGEQHSEYPNNQSARTLWYHDHAMGTTGRNVAAGLAGLYIIHDEYERSLNLPSGDYDIPLVIQSKGLSSDGSLYYTKKIGLEFYGNTLFVNGKLAPYLEVEPRKYRFRILNGSNARTVSLGLLDNTNLGVLGPLIYQIGSDSGFLEETVVLNGPGSPSTQRIVLAPAERADVIIDFAKNEGREFLLQNNAIPDDADSVMPLPKVLFIKVNKPLAGPDTSSLPMKMKPIVRFQESEAVKTRQMVLNSTKMADGTSMLQINHATWTDPITERPVLGTKEIWQIVNTLPDAHPFHIHLVDFQVLDRTPYDVSNYLKTGEIKFTGPPQKPFLNEMGWKDTVRVIPGFVTRIIMEFKPYEGFYIYHCHILEHEDMDMMRPFQIVSH